MKKLIIAVTIAVVLLLTLGSGLALAAAAPKATGGISFVNAGLNASSEFNAHDVGAPGSDKGEFRYADPNGWYRFDVYSARVVGDDAFFTGEVAASTYPGIPVGAWVYIAVHDGGTLGRNGDLINGAVTNMATALGWVNTGFLAGTGLTPYEGNLVVHN